MNHNFVDLFGEKYGRLTVLRLNKNRTRQGGARWDCKCECGKNKTLSAESLKAGKVKSCGCLRRELISRRASRTGSGHHCWKGGVYQTKKGYRAISSGPNKGKYEHTETMEKFLGRPLLDYETVHHKNGNRADNRIENLELWASRHCRGQRVLDLTDWAIQHLKQYAPHLLK